MMGADPCCFPSLSFDEGERWRVNPMDALPVNAFLFVFGRASRLSFVPLGRGRGG